jgi:hypothetical protein
MRNILSEPLEAMSLKETKLKTRGLLLNYYSLTSLFYLFSLSISAQPALSVSYVEHPAVKNIYLPIIKAMYKEANLKAQFFKVSNSPRSIRALNDGLFDADIGKILSSIKHHENIIYVPIPIATIGLYLVCRYDVICDETVLDSHSNMIVSRFSKDMLTNIVPIKAEIAQILSQKKINKMLSIGRANYSLIADDTRLGATNFEDNYTVVLLSKEYYYHILHKKNETIIPVLNLALKMVLGERSSDKYNREKKY